MTDVQAANSTTVRSHVRIPTGVRVGIAAADRVAPALVARWGLYAWCRPARPHRRHDVPGGTAWTLPFGRSRILGRTWGEGPPVYLVHGWGGYGTQLAAFVTPLVDAGLRVVTYDAPSHGDSGPGAFGPRQSTLPEMVDALAAVVQEHGPARGIVGHSLGGATSALAVLDGVAAPDRLALVAPMGDPMPYTHDFAHVLGFSEATRVRMVALMEQRAMRSMTEFDIPARAAAHASPLPPLLVAHDEQDKEAAYTDGVAVASAWPGGRLLTSTGLGHRRILRDEATVAEIVRHLL